MHSVINSYIELRARKLKFTNHNILKIYRLQTEQSALASNDKYLIKFLSEEGLLNKHLSFEAYIFFQNIMICEAI